MTNRNGYMLHGSLAKRGYDWWWHSFNGVNKITGEIKPFFIEYFFINPAISRDKVILGQLPSNDNKAQKPSYAMIKAGAWGKDKAQIHNFFPINKSFASKEMMKVTIGDNSADDTALTGSVTLSDDEAKKHPEYMSQSGTMSWELKLDKKLKYSVGYGASWFFRAINTFMMYWHVEGMRTLYSGTVKYNGVEYEVRPETSYGYQDKNWGSDYTNPWIWLNCNNFTDQKTGLPTPETSLDAGGGRPVMFGRSFDRKFLVAFYHDGKMYEFNFSKFWRGDKQKFECKVLDDRVTWHVDSWNNKYKIEIDFYCPLETMLLVNYENPDGYKNHKNLYNGGYAEGTVTLSQKKGKSYEIIGSFYGKNGGCEYGEY